MVAENSSKSLPSRTSDNSSQTSDSKGPLKLKKRIGLFSSIGIIVGTIIGSGIFVTPRGVYEGAGSVGFSLIIWAACGILSMVGAICYAELGTTITKSGGDYSYILEAFGPLLAFLQLWVNLIVLRPTAQVVIALTFGYYAIHPFYPYCEPPPGLVKLLAASCISILTIINLMSVRAAMRIQDVFTTAKLLALVIIILAGVVQLCRGEVEFFEDPFEGSSTSATKISLAFYSGLYSYFGWNFLNFVTEELEDPYRNLPRAIYISLPLVTGLFVMVNIAYFTVVSPFEVLSSNAVGVTFGNKLFSVMSWIVPIFVALSTFGGVNGMLFTSGRLFFVGAREGHLPNLLAMIQVKNLTPLPAILFTGTLSLCMLVSDDVLALINYVSFVQWLSVGLSIVALVYLRYTKPNLPRPLKFPIFIPISFLVAVLFLLIIPFVAAPREAGIGLIITLSGIPVYYLGIVWKSKPKFFQKVIHYVTTQLQKIFLVVPSDKS